MSLLDRINEILTQQRESEARVKGCFMFHFPIHEEVKQSSRPPPTLEAEQSDTRPKQKQRTDSVSRYDLWGDFQERRAIMQFDGGADIETAEQLAFYDCLSGWALE
jgi:hypothetical protein